MLREKWIHKLNIMSALFVLLMTAALPYSVGAEGNTEEVDPYPNKIVGEGQQVDIGSNLAQLKLPENYIMLNKQDTEKFITSGGQKVSGEELALVSPIDSDWLVYFDYTDSGHIKDDEKSEIDADALLKSYKEGTEQANKDIEQENQLFIDGWDTPPKYDENLHSLTWAMKVHNQAKESLINYNVRILTREGYISAVLAVDPAELTTAKAAMQNDLLQGFTVKAGAQYSDYVESKDKTAQYGLTGLVLGGAGLAVAKKTGLLVIIILILKKAGIFIIAGLAWLWRFVRGRRKKKNQNDVDVLPPQDPPAPLDH